jgi:hypothetical protein
VFVALPYSTKDVFMFLRAISTIFSNAFHGSRQIPYLLSVQQTNQKEMAVSLAFDRNSGLLPENMQNSFLLD